MTVRFGVVATAIALCGAVLAWAALSPEIVLRIEPHGISSRGGHAFVWQVVAPAYLPAAVIAGDDVGNPQSSGLQVYEQGRPLGPAHALHKEIEDAGSGRFSHWLSIVIFSASDNTDPRTNGRVYEAHARIAPPPHLATAADALAVMLAGLLLVRGLSKPQVLAAMRKAASRTAEFTRRGLHASMRLVRSTRRFATRAAAFARRGLHASMRLARSTRRLAPRAAAFARHVTPALPMPFLLVSTLLLSGVIVWSLFPPQGAWRIEPGDIAPRAGRSFAWNVPQPALHPFAIVRGDDNAAKRSRLALYQDGRLLGPPYAVHALISDIGAGLYSHWDDAVVFASPDNSDPRTNGRAYEARAPVVPAPWLMPAIAGIFAGALVAARRHRLRTSAPDDTRWARVVACGPGAILLVAAVAATVSLLGVFRVERIVPAAALSPDLPQAILEQSERVSRDGVYALDFHRFHAPFLEIDCCAQVDVRRGATPILHDKEFDPEPFDPRDIVKELRLRPDNRFFDLEDYLYFRFDTPPQWHETLSITFPVKARIELIIALWILAIALFASRRRIERLVLRPSAGAALMGIATASATVGVLLLAVNLTGLFVPLRYAEIDHPSPATLRRSYGPGDATMTWAAARTQLAPGPAESRAAYAHRLTDVIAQSVMHYWYERDRRRFRLQVPIWENYLLWLAGELRPDYRLYAFADPLKAIERGAGMCDQVSSALIALLRQRDFDARVVQLNGHTVVTAEVDPGVWHVLDADFNVVIPRSIAQIQADPGMVRPYYQSAFARIDPNSGKFSPDLFVSYYATDSYIGDAGANAALGERRIRFEAMAYWLKWRLPLMLLVVALISAGLRIWLRGRGAPVAAGRPWSEAERAV